MKCSLCGEEAGFLRQRHRECAEQAVALTDYAVDAARVPDRLEALDTALGRSALGAPAKERIAREAFERAVAAMLDDGAVSEEEKRALDAFRAHFALPASLCGEAIERGYLLGYALDAARDPDRLEALESALAGSALAAPAKERILREEFERTVDAMLEDGVVNDDERAALYAFRERFGLPEDLRQAAIRDGSLLNFVLEGRADEINLEVEGARLPFNLQKSENLVFAGNASYAKTVTEREFRGGSLGASVRVANGLYLRPSAFRGRPVSKSSMQGVDAGFLGLTTKHIYFAGETERFRVRYDRIVTFEPYDDGLGFMRDAARAKPEAFSDIDGWFVYNLVTNLAQA